MGPTGVSLALASRPGALGLTAGDGKPPVSNWGTLSFLCLGDRLPPIGFFRDVRGLE